MLRKKTDKKEVTDYILKNYQSFNRLAYSYVRNPDDALDIVQEAILKAISSCDKLGNAESIKTWFYRIVVNTSLDFLRKRKKIEVFTDEELIKSLPGPDNDFKNLDLEQVLDALPPSYRVVVVLRYFEDLKLEDIAMILNENVSTVKTRLYTALKKLRLEMQD